VGGDEIHPGPPNGLKYLLWDKTGRAHVQEIGAGLERAKKKYPASMQTPELISDIHDRQRGLRIQET